MDTARDIRGRFIKGVHAHPSTEFKVGEHWRPHKLFRDYEWLYTEYSTKCRSAVSIANEFDVTEGAILFWLRKHNIPRRSMIDIRAKKHWGLSGSKNGMFGKRGEESPTWKGGLTPERQLFYSSVEWKSVSKIVRTRDRHECQRCGIKSDRYNRLHIHHIVPFDIVELRTDIDNLILLCKNCHIWVHSKLNINKDYIREEVRND